MFNISGMLLRDICSHVQPMYKSLHNELQLWPFLRRKIGQL